MKARVFEPLGMRDTRVKAYQGEIIPGSAQGYVPAESGGLRTARDLPASYGAGGIYTTFADLTKWMLNYGDAGLGGPEAIAALATPATLENGESTEYGLGLGVVEIDGQPLYTHTGGDVAHRSFEVLKPGGRAAFIASGAKAPQSPRNDVTSLRPAVGRDRPHLERIIALAKAGAVRIPEIKTYPLSEAAAAVTLSKARHIRGKLVLGVR